LGLGGFPTAHILNVSHVIEKWKSSLKQPLRLDSSKGGFMLEIFFDAQCLVRYEFIPKERTENNEIYCHIPGRVM
jgi:hypothetical protein